MKLKEKLHDKAIHAEYVCTKHHKVITHNIQKLNKMNGITAAN